MNFIYPRCIIMSDIHNEKKFLSNIEKAGRVCYKSESKITNDSYKKFIKNAIKLGHHSIIEHKYITVKFVVNRGILAEITRHRIANYSVESTRYCKYNNKDMTYIIPLWATNILEGKYDDLTDAMKKIKCLFPCEREYISILEDISDSYDNLTVEYEWKAEMARDILPNALKTEIFMTANLREWRHILDLRTTQGCHPQMKEIIFPLLEEFNKKLPTIFEDIYSKKIDEYKNKKYNTKIEYDLGDE